MIIDTIGEIAFISLTMLVPVIEIPKYEQERAVKGCQELAEEFPEALFFWTPNHYYNLFLQRAYPSLAPYRPLLADVLRYDYQVSEYLEEYSLIKPDSLPL